MPMTQAQLNIDLLNIKIFHSRCGDDYAKSLAYHSGNWWYLQHLFQKIFLVGNYIECLQRYDADGSDTVENILTNEEAEDIVAACYRELEQWNT